MNATKTNSNTDVSTLHESVHTTQPIVPSARFPGLVEHVSHWQLIQATRIKMELPEKAIVRSLTKQGHPHPQAPTWLVLIRETLDAVEQTAEKQILQEWRHHPLRPWGLSIPAVGEHSLAVLVGLLDGDPYVAYPKQRVGAKGASKIYELEPYVRTFGQLRAYCGAGDADRKRRAGMTQDDALAAGKPLLKSRLWSIADIGSKRTCAAHQARNKLLKAEHNASPSWAPPPADCTCEQDGLVLRLLFDQYRADAETRGDWTPAHRRNHALRLVYKEFLRWLYDESERLHKSGEWKLC